MVVQTHAYLAVIILVHRAVAHHVVEDVLAAKADAIILVTIIAPAAVSEQVHQDVITVVLDVVINALLHVKKIVVHIAKADAQAVLEHVQGAPTRVLEHVLEHALAALDALDVKICAKVLA